MKWYEPKTDLELVAYRLGAQGYRSGQTLSETLRSAQFDKLISYDVLNNWGPGYIACSRGWLQTRITSAIIEA